MDANLARQILTARASLSSMPDDVFDIYLVPLIKRHGWPFDVSGFPLDIAEARRWFQMLDHQSVKTISQLSWERCEIPFPLARFHPRSHQVVTMIIEHHTGVCFHAGIADVADTRNKLVRARNYIARTGQMPVPVILQRDPLGLRVLDGNHRLAAMASLPNAESGIIDAWIGSL